MTITVCLLLFSFFCAVAVGQTSKHHAAKSTVVQGSGCVEKAVEKSCHVVIDSQTGDIYDLFFSARVPKSGTAIRFKATAHQGMTSCMEGKPVSVTSWKKEKGIKCPPPAWVDALNSNPRMAHSNQDPLQSNPNGGAREP